ncbi:MULTISPECIES: hypothetical protein [unclassified Streptomyces]|uniref:hypothetical protein n=1 Tax=unclassified Streptomyces TaxID=2593676 RepID=UPI000DC7691E|nr:MULTISPECIES: hypothetical protein [unclassified Streptomyces]AWZ05922.1 hypothetical protein DRB89_16200 [Streptomyces sp. ICC4]AWZ12955.1 hypothetical protein DRB96_12160 [Streptomyces sp. ICC1]
MWARVDRVRAAWWALSGRDRIAVEGLLVTGVLLAAAWRAGDLGLVQADFVLSVLGGTAGVAKGLVVCGWWVGVCAGSSGSTPVS